MPSLLGSPPTTLLLAGSRAHLLAGAARVPASQTGVRAMTLLAGRPNPITRPAGAAMKTLTTHQAGTPTITYRDGTTMTLPITQTTGIPIPMPTLQQAGATMIPPAAGLPITTHLARATTQMQKILQAGTQTITHQAGVTLPGTKDIPTTCPGGIPTRIPATIH